MAGFDAFRYDGKRVLVVGGATGMGAAAAQTVADAGAEVTVFDIAPVTYAGVTAVEVDVRDKAALDAALDGLEGTIDALFCAAGIADSPDVMKVNFIAHRHTIERLIEAGKLGRGSAICMISSVAGIGWEASLPTLIDFLASPDFEAADKWVAAHEGTNNYMFSKQAMNAYVSRISYPFASKGIRINAICPGPTDTPLARANGWLDEFGADYREATGQATPLQPSQQGNTMVFLNSDAASGISGVNLLVDTGHVMSSIGGTWEPGAPVIEFLMTAQAMAAP